MKQMRYFLCVLFAIAFGAQTQAQEIIDGEAFYIYRNDGGFNGFFFDEVLDMSYSKFDLDSIEHDDYVVQDVVTADSVYRIPLCAIDSVGFVQPEIILNSRFRNLDELGVTPYVLGGKTMSDSYNRRYKLVLSPQIPSHLVPVVDDVVAGFDPEVYKDVRAFRVTERNDNDPEGIVLYGHPINGLEDIFVQFITVERVIGNVEDGVRCRRMAGYKGLKKVSGSFGGNVFNTSTTLQLDVSDKEWLSVVGSMTVGMNFSIDMSYNISLKSLYIKADLRQTFSAQVGASVSVKGGITKTYPLPGKDKTAVRFPPKIPIFEVNPGPDVFVSLDGSITAAITSPTFTYDARQSVTFNTDATPMIEGRWDDTKSAPGAEEHQYVTPADATLSLNGSMQFGLSEDLKVSTLTWVADVFSADVGVNVKVGPKLSGNISVSTLGAITDGLYGAIKDTKATVAAISIDAEGSAQMRFMDWKPRTVTFFSNSTAFLEQEFKLLPDLSSLDVEYDERHTSLKGKMQLGGKLLTAVDVVMRIYSLKTDKLVKSISKYYSGLHGDQEFEFNFSESGFYRIVPEVHLAGVEIPIESKAVEVKLAPKVELSANQVDFKAQSGNGGRQKQVVTFKCDEPVHLRNALMFADVTVDNTNNTIVLECDDNNDGYIKEETISVVPEGFEDLEEFVAVPLVVRQGINSGMISNFDLSVAGDAVIHSNTTYNDHGTVNTIEEDFELGWSHCVTMYGGSLYDRSLEGAIATAVESNGILTLTIQHNYAPKDRNYVNKVEYEKDGREKTTSTQTYFEDYKITATINVSSREDFGLISLEIDYSSKNEGNWQTDYYTGAAHDYEVVKSEKGRLKILEMLKCNLGSTAGRIKGALHVEGSRYDISLQYDRLAEVLSGWRHSLSDYHYGYFSYPLDHSEESTWDYIFPTPEIIQVSFTIGDMTPVP